MEAQEGTGLLTRSVRPNLPVRGASKPFLETELLEVRIATVLIDARNDKLAFLGRQECYRSGLLVVGERYQKDVAKERHQAGQLGRYQSAYPFQAKVGLQELHTQPSMMKIHRHPPYPWIPSICIKPKARIPPKAEAREPMR